MLPTANRIPAHLSGFDVMALNMLGQSYLANPTWPILSSQSYLANPNCAITAGQSYLSVQSQLANHIAHYLKHPFTINGQNRTCSANSSGFQVATPIGY